MTEIEHEYNTLLLSMFANGIPRPQGSKRHLGNGIMIEQSKGLGDWKHHLRHEAAREMQEIECSVFDCPVHLWLRFYFVRPASHYNKKKELRKNAPEYYAQTPDIDKLIRAVGDALTGIVWKDDRKIIGVDAVKEWSDTRSGCKIEVWDPNQ